MKKSNLIVFIFIVLIIFGSIISLFRSILDEHVFNNVMLNNNLTVDEKQWLKDHGSIIYGADENSPPLMFIDNEDNQYTGFTIDYINALSLEIGAEVKHKSYVWEEALEKLAIGETDICDMFPSKERSRQYDFSDPLYSLRSIVVVPDQGNEISNISDLEGKKITLPKGDYGIEYLKENFQNIEFVLTDNVEDAIEKMLNGEADALLADEPVATYYIEKQKIYSQIKILDEAAYESDVVFAVKKGNKVLLSIINKGIKALHDKQTINKIQLKWFGFSDSLAKEKMDIRILLLLVFTILAIITSTYISYLWNKALKIQVLKRTEELSNSKEELKITFDSITNLLIIIDNNYNVVDVNDSLLEFINDKKENVLGKNLHEIEGVDVLAANLEIVEKTFELQTKMTKEIKLEDKFYKIKTFPFKKVESQLKKAILMIEDVSNERLLENQIIHSSKMAAIGQLAAGVAHEIRNPLGLIRNYIFVLDKKIRTDDENVKKSIKVIGESVEVTSHIIDNLLNFSRMFGDKYLMTNFREFVENIIQLEKVFFEKRKIECIIHCDESVNVIINRESLKHIIINLIENAIDAMPKGGRLTLSAYIAKNRFVFLCEDTGVGISEDDIESIFNPFYTKKVSRKGTGLGLYVVYNEIMKHGGSIDVSSKVCEGTTFSISLPLIVDQKIV